MLDDELAGRGAVSPGSRHCPRRGGASGAKRATKRAAKRAAERAAKRRRRRHGRQKLQETDKSRVFGFLRMQHRLLLRLKGSEERAEGAPYLNDGGE